MKRIPAILAVFVLAGLAGCKPDLHGPWPKPALAAHRTPPPADGDGLAAELKLGQKNFFDLQDFYFGLGEGGFPRKRQQVHELTADEKSWAAAAVAAESEALGRLLPDMEKALKASVAAEERPVPGTPHVSLGIFMDSDEPWELAQARANLAGNLAYLHGLRRSLRATDAQKAEAVKWADEARSDLAALERSGPKRRRGAKRRN